MRFDPTITLGVVLHLIALVGAIVGGYIKIVGRIERYHAENDTRLRVLESRVGDVWEEFIGRKRGGQGRTYWP